MDCFSKALFQKTDAAGRSVQCAELSKRLGDRLTDEADFHQGSMKLVGELRALGHDLWTFDESDEMEVWC